MSKFSMWKVTVGSALSNSHSAGGGGRDKSFVSSKVKESQKIGLEKFPTAWWGGGGGSAAAVSIGKKSSHFRTLFHFSKIQKNVCPPSNLPSGNILKPDFLLNKF